MKRPNVWFRVLLALCLIVILGEYVALTWLGPLHVMRWVQTMAGGQLTIGAVRLSFPLMTTLMNMQLAKSPPEAFLDIQRVAVLPRWFFVTSRQLWLERLEIDRPLVRFTRTQTGELIWPRTSESVELPDPQGSWLVRLGASSWRLPWSTYIHSIQVTDGAIEFVDQMTTPPFRGLLDHIAVVMGPVRLPHGDSQLNFAARATFVGHGGLTAPCYCSGWIDVQREDIEASCQVEPVPLAAFEPYYHGLAEIRVYTTKLSLTSQWLVRSNQLNARIQWQLTHLSEGDLSVHGRTVLDLKRLLPLKDPAFRGEIALSGSADETHNWYAELIPGDVLVQQLVQRLLNRGVERITIPWWGHQFSLSLIPANQSTMSDIATTSKQIQEALEILALPTTEGVSVTVPEEAIEETVSSTEVSPTAAPEIQSETEETSPTLFLQTPELAVPPTAPDASSQSLPDTVPPPTR